ncbi:MAG: PEP-CTERM sorting domain-containing protein [Phycisphaerales bacterium]|nr:PEP-CTERM sorting domain-containing protein [Phycisphaerales bacterium]
MTSSSWKIDNSILLGDLLMNTDGLPGFDMGLVTQTASKGLPAGQVYDNVSTAGLQINSNTYAGNFNIESQINNTPGQLAAMFVSGGDPTGPVGSINTTSYNYGTINQNGLNKNENNSYLYEFTFELPPTFTTVDFQISWGCGNDVISASHIVTHPAVPEPATMATGMLALTGLILGVTRRRA